MYTRSFLILFSKLQRSPLHHLYLGFPDHLTYKSELYCKDISWRLSYPLIVSRSDISYSCGSVSTENFYCDVGFFRVYMSVCNGTSVFNLLSTTMLRSHTFTLLPSKLTILGIPVRYESLYLIHDTLFLLLKTYPSGRRHVTRTVLCTFRL